MFRFARKPPLRQTAVIGCPSVCQGWLSCWLCVAYFFFNEGKKKFEVLSCRKMGRLFYKLWFACRFVRFANVPVPVQLAIIIQS